MVNNIVVDPESYETEAPTGLEQEEQTIGSEAVEETQAEDEYQVPDKFRGKSVEEIVDSYSQLEKELGRKGQEIGELRKLTEDFIKTQTNQQAESPKEDPLDFYDDPDKYIEEKIKNNPKIKAAEKQLEERQHEVTLQKLQTQHPDAQTVVESSDFQEWISQSKIRQRLFQEANAYDFDAANELLSTWKDRQLISKTKEVESAKEASKEKALKTGRTESRSSGESVGGKKVYRSADLIRLKINDPERYNAMSDEILMAYAEDRVK